MFMRAITKLDLKLLREEELIKKKNQFINFFAQNATETVCKLAKEGKTTAQYEKVIDDNDIIDFVNYMKDEILNSLQRIFVDSQIYVFYTGTTMKSMTVIINWE